MRVAFYAPMKPPDDPTPSGDRRMSRLLMEALQRGGHQVQVASKFSSREGSGNTVRQQRLRDMGVTTATRLVQRAEMLRPELKPDLWFTYHLYHKAPDWIGPGFAKLLGIPYVVAEASVAPKQAGGQWDLGYRAVLDALKDAAIVFNLNSNDAPCVLNVLDNPHKLISLKPFLDPTPFIDARGHYAPARQALARRFNLNPDKPWLLTVAMMRYGDKLDSYWQLGNALSLIADLDFELIVIGDGPAYAQVSQALRPLGQRVSLLGQAAPETLPVIAGASDLFVWPAVNEAYGMALLEAQAAGVPVVAGNYGGVTDIIQHGITGLVTPPQDMAAFAGAVRDLLTDPTRRVAMGQAAMKSVETYHSLDRVARQINDVITPLAGRQWAETG